MFHKAALPRPCWSSAFRLRSAVATDFSVFLTKYVIGSRLRHRLMGNIYIRAVYHLLASQVIWFMSLNGFRLPAFGKGRTRSKPENPRGTPVEQQIGRSECLPFYFEGGWQNRRVAE